MTPHACSCGEEDARWAEWRSVLFGACCDQRGGKKWSLLFPYGLCGVDEGWCFCDQHGGKNWSFYFLPASVERTRGGVSAPCACVDHLWRHVTLSRPSQHGGGPDEVFSVSLWGIMGWPAQIPTFPANCGEAKRKEMFLVAWTPLPDSVSEDCRSSTNGLSEKGLTARAD